LRHHSGGRPLLEQALRSAFSAAGAQPFAAGSNPVEAAIASYGREELEMHEYVMDPK
jgi:hypothetical protein